MIEKNARFGFLARTQTVLALLCTLAAGPLAAQDPFDGLNRSGTPGARGGTAAAHRSSPAARERRACIAIQKTIAGAVEMYNLDHNTNVDHLGAAFLGTLAKEGYLTEVPQDPGWGANTADHYVLDSGGNGVACRVHGSASTVDLTEEQLCFANEKLIAGAIEMYSLDNNTKVDSIDAAFLQTLVDKGYLEFRPDDPGQGADSMGHYSLTATGIGVTCSVHGSPSEAPKQAKAKE